MECIFNRDYPLKGNDNFSLLQGILQRMKSGLFTTTWHGKIWAKQKTIFTNAVYLEGLEELCVLQRSVNSVNSKTSQINQRKVAIDAICNLQLSFRFQGYLLVEPTLFNLATPATTIAMNLLISLLSDTLLRYSRT